MTPGQYSAISYATHHFCNPLSPATLDRTLALADLSPGQTALDLGCGNGLLALHLAERYGLRVSAGDIAPEMIDLARVRVADRGAPGSISLRTISNAEALAEADAPGLIVANGAWGVLEGRPEPERVLARLAQAAPPGGYVLWGDPFLKSEPPARLRMLLQAVDYRPHADYVAAGEAAGLKLRYAAVSPEQDFDDYILRIFTSVERWFEDHPDHPEAERRLTHNRMVRDLHLQEGRNALGFGLYLFQR